MNISELFIRRAITTTLIMAGIMAFGLFAYRSLPVSDLPNVDFPTVAVAAALPGASPFTMASAVATPLERQFSTIAGLDSMNSASSLGNTQIVLQFDLSRDIDAAAQDVQAAISRAGSQLPPGMPAPPSYQKVNPADAPILYVAVSSPTLPLSQVDEYAETLMAQRISMVSGVAQVQVFGSQKYAVRVQLNPRALASRGLGIDDVRQALNNANVNLPGGTLDGRTKAYTVQATGQLSSASAFRPLIVAYRDGNPVRLAELGEVRDSVENDKVASWFKNDRAVILAIQRQPGTNTVKVVDGIRDLLPSFRSDIPASVNLDILYDRSASIRESIADVKFTLGLAIVLVVGVIFFFLRNASATLIPSLAVPLSIVATFAAMSLLGYTVDNLSMLALVLSVGFLVDDAIVMLENIVRHQDMGKSKAQAAFDGSKEIGFTILSMTLSLAAVFIPVLFMGGILGRLLREFAVTISVAILVSGFISLTLTPMLCSRFLRPESERKHGRLYRLSGRVFDGMLRAYDRSLVKVLQYRGAMIALLAGMIVVTGYLLVKVPKGMLPTEDTGQIFAQTEAAQDVSFDEMARHQRALAEIVRRNPYVSEFMSSVGGGARGGAGNTGRIFMHLVERSRRPPAGAIIQQLRPQFARIPGIRVYMQVPPSIRVGGSLTKGLYQFTLQDTDTTRLYQWAPKVEARLKQLPVLEDVSSDLQLASPQLTVDIDRDKAQVLGVTASAIENALYDAYGQRQVSTIYTPSNEYYVIMEVLDDYQRDPAALSELYVRSATGQLVPLATLCRFQPTVAPLTVNHFGQLPAVTISFNLPPGASLGQAVDRITDATRQMGLPRTMTMAFQGVAEAFQSSLKGLGLLLIMAILVIYLVLGVLYESFIHPLTILSGLPSAGLGALVTLMIFKVDLNLYAFVGLIMLIGIVKKNAIMMIDFAIAAQRNERKSPAAAIYEGCLLRFRPIMMTTMSALLGTLPIALGIGAGGESRQPLGLAVVGGLVISQFITLYLTPVVYIYLEAFREWLTTRRTAAPLHDRMPSAA
jgi:hydrophobic/amphiphilic exporter-1 (mainly G- bacteria), HAE1 family